MPPRTNIKFNAELNAAVKKIEKLRSDFASKELEDVVDKAASVFEQAAQANAPQSDEVHYRYDTPKVSNNIKAPKGKGVKVAEYHPGNLERGIQIIKKLTTKLQRVVGPKKHRGSASGKFSSKRRTDPYYAHMVHFGTENIPANPFITRAVGQTKSIVKSILTKGARRIAQKHARS